MTQKLLFVIGLLFVTTPWASPGIALGLGLLFGITCAHPFQHHVQRLSKSLLQTCVVGLGFGMNLHELLRAGRSSFLYTLVGISFVMLVGMSLAKLIGVGSKNGLLIAVGTAICGGSAIAAVGPVVEATNEEMAVSLGTVFILNSLALVVFPAVGGTVGLTEEQFGLWAALAIHDTSSVVGAGIKYGAVALTVATTVKLARVIWIVPVVLIVAIGNGSSERIRWPWFILLFLIAAIVSTYLPMAARIFNLTSALSKTGLIVCLYLIGSTISLAALKTLGARALLHGSLLWLVVAVTSLGLIYKRIIGL